MDIKQRLTENEDKLKAVQAQLQQLQETNQQLLQELLRLDGQHILLLELSKEAQK